MKMIPQKLVVRLTLAVCLGTALSACAPLIVGGAVVGTMMATDRRTAGSQIDDEGIKIRADNRIKEHLGDRVRVDVTSYNRQVLLTGEVPSARDKQLVEQVVSRVDNVRAIINEVAILGSSTLTQRSSDVFVTGKVKASLLDAKDLQFRAFKVVTERGVTYLMGRVTQREADLATQITRSTAGVQKVVRVLEIITEDELRGILPKPSAADARK